MSFIRCLVEKMSPSEEKKVKILANQNRKVLCKVKVFFDQSEYFFQSVKNILAGKSIKCEKTPHSFIEKSFIFAISSSLL